MSLLHYLAIGHAGSNDVNKIENIVTANLPYHATATVPKNEAAKVVDAAQNQEKLIPGILPHVASITESHPVSAVSHTWENPELHSSLIDYVPIPWAHNNAG